MFRHERREERREALVVGAVVANGVERRHERREERYEEHHHQDAPPPAYYDAPPAGYPPPGVQYYPPVAPAFAAPPEENVNVTVVIPSAPKAAAPSASLAKDALTWDTERVIKHLQSIGMPASDIASCEEAEVTGEDLVTADEDDLHKDLKISKLHVRKIKRSLGVE